MANMTERIADAIRAEIEKLSSPEVVKIKYEILAEVKTVIEDLKVEVKADIEKHFAELAAQLTPKQ